MQRRDCLKIIGAAGLLSPLSQVLAFNGGNQKPGIVTSDIYIFSKVLHWLNYEGLAKTVKQIGFDGVDLTVRPDGHVVPEKVATDLPKAINALQKAGLKADMMTTNITSIRQPHTENILKTASSVGVKYYRMGWLDYDLKLPIAEQIEKFKPVLKELEQMNEHYKISGGYQNHYGTSVGAPVWDIYMLIKDLNPKWLGCQYDIRHAMVEGMNSWELGLRLLQTNIQSLGFKDFVYVQSGKGWTIKNTPLGDGAIDFKNYIKLINELGISAPISMHAEYDLGGAEKGDKQITIPAENVVAALQQDLQRLKQFLGKN